MAAPKTRYSAKDEQKIMTEFWDPQIANDPEQFVLFAFPWGKEGSPLEKFKSPRTWQRDELQAIAAHIKNNMEREAQGLAPQVYKSATASGRGIGKSALVAWLNLWFLSTRIGGTAINAANTELQLKSRTWAELGKWHTMAMNSHWFEKSALSLTPAPWFGDGLKSQLQIDTTYYYAQAQLWSEENPDAFAGMHSQIGTLLVFDEASGIPENIFSVSEGFFTDVTLHRYWFLFSNPRRNTGAFFECFHKHRNFWKTRNIDARTIEGTDIQVYEEIIAKHGDDSDPARVEVKGQFPRTGDKQFISREVVQDAVDRDLVADVGAPLIMGVDPARFGSDSTVIRFRQGRNARVIPPIKFRGADNMRVANECAHLINKYNPDAVCIDAGNGTGIIDRLREMKFKVHEVWFGAKSPEEQWANQRTYLWAKMREWLTGACIDKDQTLYDDLTGPEYKFMGSSDKQMLEAKEDMKKRGLASPDDGDALACTFAVNVARRDRAASRAGTKPGRVARDVDYSIFG